jgi:hypothetical protein
VFDRTPVLRGAPRDFLHVRQDTVRLFTISAV